MAKRILKYKLPRDGGVITITANVVKWLDIQKQNGWPVIWAVVDDAGYESEYEIVAWGTGWDFPDELNRCRYMGTAQDGAGYVWHYFMLEKSKSWSPADSAIAPAPVEGIDYWNELLSITPATVTDYTVKITCGDAQTYNDYSTSIDALQGVVEYLTTAVAAGKTEAINALA